MSSLPFSPSDFFRLAGLLSNKSLIEVALKRVAPDSSLKILRIGCHIKHHKKEPLLLLQRKYQGNLKQTDGGYKLSLLKSGAIALLKDFSPYNYQYERLRLSLEVMELKEEKTRGSRRELFEQYYAEIKEAAKKPHELVLDSVLSSNLSSFCLGLFEETFNAGIDKKDQKSLVWASCFFKSDSLRCLFNQTFGTDIKEHGILTKKDLNKLLENSVIKASPSYKEIIPVFLSKIGQIEEGKLIEKVSFRDL